MKHLDNTTPAALAAIDAASLLKELARDILVIQQAFDALAKGFGLEGFGPELRETGKRLGVTPCPMSSTGADERAYLKALEFEAVNAFSRIACAAKTWGEWVESVSGLKVI